MKWIRAFPHLTIILSAMCLVFFVLDQVNGNMAFLSNEITKWIVAALSAAAIVTSVLCIGGYLAADDAESDAEDDAPEDEEAPAAPRPADPAAGRTRLPIKSQFGGEDEPLPPFDKEL